MTGKGRNGPEWEQEGEGVGIIYRRDSREAQRDRRMNGNMQLAVVVMGNGKNFQKVPEIWVVRGTQDLIWVTLAKMSTTGEMEPEESTTSSWMGPPMKGWGNQSTFKNSDPELFLSKRNAGAEIKQSVKEWPTSDRPNMGFRSLAQLSSERLYQQITKTDTYSQPLV